MVALGLIKQTSVLLCTEGCIPNNLINNSATKENQSKMNVRMDGISH